MLAAENGIYRVMLSNSRGDGGSRCTGGGDECDISRIGRVSGSDRVGFRTAMGSCGGGKIFNGDGAENFIAF